MDLNKKEEYTEKGGSMVVYYMSTVNPNCFYVRKCKDRYLWFIKSEKKTYESIYTDFSFNRAINNGNIIELTPLLKALHLKGMSIP